MKLLALQDSVGTPMASFGVSLPKMSAEFSWRQCVSCCMLRA